MKKYFSYENIFFPMKKIFFLRCEVWDKVVAQKGALPPSKVVLEAKNRPKKLWKNIFFFILFFFFYLFLFF